MNRKTFKLMLAGVLTACALGGVAVRLAGATSASGLTSTALSGPVLLDQVDAHSETDGHEVEIKAKGWSHVYVSHLKIIPGGHGGWHSHPGPSIISVKSGQATFYHADDPNRTPNVYPAGTGFVEDGGDVHILRNEGSTDLEVVVLQMVPAGAPRRIDEPKPAHYPF